MPSYAYLVRSAQLISPVLAYQRWSDIPNNVKRNDPKILRLPLKVPEKRTCDTICAVNISFLNHVVLYC